MPGREGEAGGPSTDRVRVLLLGRTGQDAVLRHDPEIELVRAYHALGAIGELASPIDADSPRATTVIVGQGAVPHDRARSFVASMRRVDPQVRVLAIATENLPMYDGIVPPDVTPDALRRLIHITAPAARSAGVAEAKRDVDQSAASLSVQPAIGLESELQPHHAESDEDAVVSALLPHADPHRKPSRAAQSALSPAAEEESPERASAQGDESASRTGPDSVGRDTALLIGSVNNDRPVVSAAALDVGPIRSMLLGENPTSAALAIVRNLSGISDLEYVRHDVQAAEAQARPWSAPSFAHIKIIYKELVLGYLHSPSQAALTAITPDQTEFFSAWAALSEQDAQLRDYAFTDELTGAFNRRYFNRFMAQVLEEASTQRQFLTVLYFDIDDFKLYNDRFGHAAGDEILIQTVALLKSVIRPGDKVCRLGGDEFAVIFYDPSGSRQLNPDSAGGAKVSGSASVQPQPTPGVPASIADIARRFQKQICAHKFPKLGDQAPGTLTISGGMATFPWDGRTGDELLARADQFLLQSKAQGKNLITLGPGIEQVCRVLGDE